MNDVAERSLVPHNLRDVRPHQRKATCDRCGEVGIKSAGKETTGRTRWRCGQQVNDYRRSVRKKQQEASFSRYALTLIRPCCGAVDTCTVPEVRTDGSAHEIYPDAACPGCGTVRTIHVAWTDEPPPDGLVAVVLYVETDQVYVNGHLDTGDWPAA